jgi:mannitol/fructose-specific phosphotransferase system IIA component (Ntr-type)
MQATESVATVRLADVFSPSAILIGATPQSKQETVQRLVHHLGVLKFLAPDEERLVVDQIMNREKVGTTALGHGIAIPNCISGLADRFLGVLAINPDGIDFDAVDGEAVNTVFLIVAPPNRREEHFDLLGKIVAIGRDKSLRIQIQGCLTPDALHHFLEEIDRSAELNLKPRKQRRFL